MFEWCKNLETHLLKDGWETIPDKDIKRMMVSCITGAARREIIPFFQMGVAFERCEAGVFFAEMMKRFLQQKYDASQGQEYLDKIQRKEEVTRRAHTEKMKLYRKQEYLDRKQKSGGNTKTYYAAKEELWLQAPNDEELKKHACFSCLKNLNRKER